MLVGLSTRRYRAGLEPVGKVEPRATSRSAISRRFVAGSKRKVAELFGRDLSQLDLLALFIDGIETAEPSAPSSAASWTRPGGRPKLSEPSRSCARSPSCSRPTIPGPAASLRKGLEETLIVTRLGLGPSLLRTFKSTNPIESMISVARTGTGNVKRGRNGEMILRWTAAGVLEAEKQFRRVNGYRDLQLLRIALVRTVQRTAAATVA